MITMKEIREQLSSIVKEIDDNEKRTSTNDYPDHTDRDNPSNYTIYQGIYGTETTERITYGYNGNTGKSEN